MSTEHPIFVPFGDGVLAGVVTVPDGPPRGLVLFLQGQGASGRANKYRLWARGARKLADKGIGALRIDLPGTGDSTGSRPSTVDDLSTAEASAVLEVAMRALGVDAFGLAGHCYGAQAFFELGEDPRARGAAFVLFADPRYLISQPQLTPVVKGPALKGPLGQPRWKKTLRGMPGMKRVVRQRRKMRARRRPWPVEFIHLAERTPTFFLALRPERAAREIHRAVSLLHRRVPSAQIDFDQVLHTGGLARMPHWAQEKVLDDLADWFDKVMPAAPARAQSAEPVSSAVGAE